MPPLDEEAKKDVQEIINGALGTLKSEIIEGVKAAAPPAAPAQQVTESPTECPNCKILQGMVESWEKGEQFLAFDENLHGKHPDSKPKVDAYVAEAIKNQTDDDLRVIITGRGYLPPLKEITLPDGRKIKPKD